MAGLGAPALALLAVSGLFGGIGISAVGPGGVLVTIALVALTPLSPPQVAGTAVVTHVATGGLAAAVYTRSGHLREPATRRRALLLVAAGAAGAPLGVLVNTVISGRGFDLALAAFVVGVALLVWRRNGRAGAATGAEPAAAAPAAGPAGWAVASAGFAVAAAAGMFGVGGPLLMVPLLVVLGIPLLSAVAAAAVQSAAIAGVATLGYLARGDVVWPLAGVVGVPELAGVLVGWLVARTLPVRALVRVLVAALLALAVYLAVRG